MAYTVYVWWQIAGTTNRAQLECIMKLLGCRAIGELNRSRWSEVLAENFTCLMPITPYRNFSQAELLNNQRCVRGIEGMIQDAQSYQVLANSLIDRARFPDIKVNCR